MPGRLRAPFLFSPETVERDADTEQSAPFFCCRHVRRHPHADARRNLMHIEVRRLWPRRPRDGSLPLGLSCDSEGLLLAGNCRLIAAALTPDGQVFFRARPPDEINAVLSAGYGAAVDISDGYPRNRTSRRLHEPRGVDTRRSCRTQSSPSGTTRPGRGTARARSRLAPQACLELRSPPALAGSFSGRARWRIQLYGWRRQPFASARGG